MILATELTPVDRAALERHFLALDADDRRLRFGAPQNDSAMRAYVERIDFSRDAVFGVWDADLQLIGAAHLARAGKRAELGKAQLGYALITSTTLFRDPSRGADSTGFGLGMIHSF